MLGVECLAANAKTLRVEACYHRDGRNLKQTLKPKGPPVFDVRFLKRMQSVPNFESARDDESDNNADQKEPAISRQHDQQNGNHSNCDDETRRSFEAESRSTARFRLHNSHSSAAFLDSHRDQSG